MICNLGVVGSNPTRGSTEREGGYQSGQMGQTVNLLAMPSVVRIHHHPLFISGNSSVDRALAFQAGGRGFEPRFPLKSLNAVIAQW